MADWTTTSPSATEVIRHSPVRPTSDSHTSRQRVVTRCTYYERYTTEEALQAAAKSYGGLTGEDFFLNPKSR